MIFPWQRKIAKADPKAAFSLQCRRKAKAKKKYFIDKMSVNDVLPAFSYCETFYTSCHPFDKARLRNTANIALRIPNFKITQHSCCLVAKHKQNSARKRWRRKSSLETRSHPLFRTLPRQDEARREKLINK